MSRTGKKTTTRGTHKLFIYIDFIALMTLSASFWFMFSCKSNPRKVLRTTVKPNMHTVKPAKFLNISNLLVDATHFNARINETLLSFEKWKLHCDWSLGCATVCIIKLNSLNSLNVSLAREACWSLVVVCDPRVCYRKSSIDASVKRILLVFEANAKLEVN